MFYQNTQNQGSTSADYVWGSGTGKGVFPGTGNETLYGGTYIKPGKYYMEISLVGMFAYSNAAGGFFNSSSGYTYSVGNPGSNDHAWSPRWIGEAGASINTSSGGFGGGGGYNGPYDHANMVHSYLAGNHEDTLYHLQFPHQKFKWAGQDKVFTITDHLTLWRYNYMTAGPAVLEQEEFFAWNVTQVGNPPSEWARRQFTHPLNRRLTFVLELDDDPTIYGNFDPLDASVFNNSNTGVAPEMVFIESNFE